MPEAPCLEVSKFPKKMPEASCLEVMCMYVLLNAATKNQNL
jgi:hypothetical protein